MSIVTFGPLIDGARGSIGGVTFSRAGSGATVRSKPRPPRPRSESQVAGQSYLGQASALWTATSPANQALWSAYAASLTLYDSLGRAYSPTGRQAFVWSYCVRAAAGISKTMTPPAALGLAVVPTLTLDYSGHGLRLTAWTPTPNTSDSIAIWAYLADRPRVFNRQRLADVSVFNGTTVLPQILVADIDGSWPVGTALRAFINVRMIDYNNRISTLLTQSLSFTAA